MRHIIIITTVHIFSFKPATVIRDHSALQNGICALERKFDTSRSMFSRRYFTDCFNSKTAKLRGMVLLRWIYFS